MSDLAMYDRTKVFEALSATIDALAATLAAVCNIDAAKELGDGR